MLVLMALMAPTSERDVRIFLWLAFIAIVLGAALAILVWFSKNVGR